MSVKGGEKAAVDSEMNNVSLFEEIIKRENKFHRLHDKYRVTLSIKKSISPGNFTNSVHPNQVSFDGNEPEDEELKQLLKQASQTPKEKFQTPQTTSQEYGWDIDFLLPNVMDNRFYHPKLATDVTRFYVKKEKLDPTKK